MGRMAIKLHVSAFLSGVDPTSLLCVGVDGSSRHNRMFTGVSFIAIWACAPEIIQSIATCSVVETRVETAHVHVHFTTCALHVQT